MNCYPGQRAEGEPAEALMEDMSDAFSYSIHDSETRKPHSTQITIKWLDQNYQLEECVCLPRSTIYEHYLDFCERESIQPVNAASFGKIIKQQFPTLTTRRLGTRGQSKYHYYGLGIKISSRYYTPDYIDKLSQGNSKKPQDTRKTAYPEKPSALLPPFPDVSSMTLTDRVPLDKLKTFMVMYRAHCQRILDSLVRANFTEVESFLLHFWQGMPTHMLPVLASDVVVDLVAHCDSLLYKVISNVLIVSPLQNLPDSLASEIRKFSDKLRQWMEVALKGLPESLQEAKYKVAEGFVNGLRRQTSLTKLAQVARGELRNSNCLEQLKTDWESLDMGLVYGQTLYAIEPFKVPSCYHELIPQFLDQFDDLFQNQQTDLEHFMHWAEDMINMTVVKAHNNDNYPLKEACQAFILTWKFFTSKILQEFTMENAPSFGFLILLHMLLDDYITHVLESKLEKEDEKVYFMRIQQMKKEDHPLPVSSTSLPSSLIEEPKLPLLSKPTPHEPHPIPVSTSFSDLHVPSILSHTISTSTIASLSPNIGSFPTVTSIISPRSTDITDIHPSRMIPLGTSSRLGGSQTLHLQSETITKTSSLSDFTYSNSSGTQSNLQGYALHGLSSSGTPHQLSQHDSTLRYPQSGPSLQSFYPSTSRQSPQQVLRTNPVVSTQSQGVISPPNNLQNSSFGGSTLVSTYDSSLQPLIGSLSSTGGHQLPSINQSFNFSRTSLSLGQPLAQAHTLPKGTALPTLPSMLPDLIRGSGASSTLNRGNPSSTTSLSSFAALNVPFPSTTVSPSPSTSSLSNSTNLSIFQGMYPYAPFVGIPTVPAQMNASFPPGSLQMPAQPNAVTGYPYIPAVTPSLYSTQVTTNSFTR